MHFTFKINRRTLAFSYKPGLGCAQIVELPRLIFQESIVCVVCCFMFFFSLPDLIIKSFCNGASAQSAASILPFVSSFALHQYPGGRRPLFSRHWSHNDVTHTKEPSIGSPQTCVMRMLYSIPLHLAVEIFSNRTLMCFSVSPSDRQNIFKLTLLCVLCFS